MLTNIKKKIRKFRDPGSCGEKRSSKWPSVRKAHLEEHPTCAVCGRSDTNVEVHHISSFHLHKELELDKNNLISLCRKAKNGDHHLIFGHFCDFKKENPNVVKDAKYFNENIIND